MSVSSPGELLTALERKQYDAITGTLEGDDLDFKEQPYQLDEEKGKWELCKDVAALANTGGGVFAVGYSLRRGPTDIAEVADELRPVPVELINPDQYKKVLSSGSSSSSSHLPCLQGRSPSGATGVRCRS